ncbi:hypothetical protein TRFO_12328 [Tritrichomonas foetus]|uniref:Uncharacterized protein n=1 Tax=Tritrichomonas foetus TaxID=1144522 RepID=A0A1J4J1Y2_9EUKA|nr:hypothetical protein TRFO_12328 [Tritrichomonas foetus]|eukprot:OHS92769.1 hypothetical protein TRFO_12328 [Tritrichomonas foetus]
MNTMMDEDKIASIQKFKNLLEIQDLNPASNDDFMFKKSKLPIQVQHLINSTQIATIKSGNITFQNEKLFWIASSLTLIIFNPESKCCISLSIESPIITIFVSKFYIILSHIGYVTLLYFPFPFSENIQYYQNNKIQKISAPIPSSYHITAACKNFAGCSDGIIRVFSIVGHPPDSQFLIKTASYSKGGLSQVKSLAIADNYLYSHDENNQLSAYQIINQTKLAQIDQPIRLPGKMIDMFPCQDSVILTKQMKGEFHIATILTPHNSYYVKNNSVLISKNIKTDSVLNTYDNTSDDIIKIDGSSFYPERVIRNGKLVQVFVAMKETPPEAVFECKLRSGDILIFMTDGFIPTPFSSLKNQIYGIEVSSSNRTQFNYEVGATIKTITTEAIEIKLVDDVFEQSNIPASSKFLRIVSYFKIPGESSSLESLFGFDSLSHSIWGELGLYCFIHSERQDYGELITMRFGYNPVAHYQKINGIIYSFLSVNRQIIIFTSKGILSISHKNPQFYGDIWNLIVDLAPFWNKKVTIQNLKLFQENIIDKYSSHSEYFPTFTTIGELINNVIEVTKNDYFDIQERLGSLIYEYKKMKQHFENHIIRQNLKEERKKARGNDQSLLTKTLTRNRPMRNDNMSYNDNQDQTLAKTFSDYPSDRNCLKSFLIEHEDSNEYPHASNIFSMWTANKIVDAYLEDPDNNIIDDMSQFRLELFDKISKTQLYE